MAGIGEAAGGCDVGGDWGLRTFQAGDLLTGLVVSDGATHLKQYTNHNKIYIVITQSSQNLISDQIHTPHQTDQSD